MMWDNRNNNGSKSGGISFAGMLTLIFVTLKLCHVIDWSWGWVLSPIWIDLIIWVIILTVYVVMGRHRR